MSKEKTTEEMIEEFLANGGKIEKIEYQEPEVKNTIGNINKKTPELMTLAEGQHMFTKKQKRRKKKKKVDLSGIDMSLIPEHLHDIVKKTSDISDNDK